MDDWEAQMCVEGGYCRPVAERERMSERNRREERMLNRLARNDPWSTPCEGERNRISRCRVKSERVWETKSSADANIGYGRPTYHRYHCCRELQQRPSEHLSVGHRTKTSTHMGGLARAGTLFEEV